jgi:molecular chaperone GrpE
MNDDDQIKEELNADPHEESAEDAEEFIETNEEGEELSGKERFKKLQEKLKEAQAEKQRYLDNWQRDKAEFINVRKRDEESKNEFLKFAEQGIFEDLLPALDSFDTAISHKEAWEALPKEWRGGMEGVYNQLKNVFNKYEVVAFGAKGDAFDPNLHHSIGGMPVGDGDIDHTVAEVLQKGYLMKGKVIRPALVKIFEA